MMVCLSICALIFVWMATAKPRESLAFAIFKRNEQKYLADHVVETEQAHSEFECGLRCIVSEKSCMSVNFKTSGIGKGRCELNNKTVEETSDVDDKIHHPEFNHLALMKLNTPQSDSTDPSQTTIPQECKNYTLFDNKERNINYRGGSYGCDRSISGWYRFDGAAGTHLPTSCVPRSDTSIIVCETHGVSWLNGSHPSISEGKVTRQVCFSWASNCCVVSTDIDVINCGSYYIYNLVPLASWCQRRYCGT